MASVTYTFTNGTVANASEVNQNFDDILAAFDTTTGHDHNDSNSKYITLTTGVTGVLPETNGGTNQSTFTQGDILYSDASNSLAKLGYGTNGHTLHTKGSGQNPEWSANLPSGSAGGDLTGTYPNPTIPTAIPKNIQVFTGDGTWTRPAGIDFVYVKVWGGGGGGASDNVTDRVHGGGGGGGYSEGLVAVSGNVTVTVGAGGIAGAAGGGNGGTGGTSSFAGDTTPQATGGGGGAVEAGGGGAGGAGSNGTINLTGGSGGDGENTGGVRAPSGGGAAMGGAGGSGGKTVAGAGEVGAIPGGGGGGAGGIAVGGVGGAGLVIVYY